MATELRRKERLDRGVKVRSEGMYAISSMKEMMFLIAPRLALILVLLILPLVAPNMYWQRIICIFGIYALLAVGFDFLANYVGLVCLGGALFTGLGGYISGLLNSALGLSPALTIPVAAVGGALISTIVLLPSLPLRGVYFAIASFIYPLVAQRLIAATGAFGGTEGIFGLSVFPDIWVSQYLIIIVLLICIFALRRLVNEDIGLVFRGVKDNDQSIKASGMNITWYRVQGVFIFALMGSFAGAYLTHLYGWVGMSLFAMDFSILPLAAAVVGGSSTLAGPLIGALILVPLSEMLRDVGALRIVFYSLVMVGFIVFWPEGLLNYFRRKYEQFEHWVRV